MTATKKLFKLMYTNPDSYLILENAFTSAKWQKKLKEGRVTTKLVGPLMEAIKIGKLESIKVKLLQYGCTLENFNLQFDAAVSKLSTTNNIPKNEIFDLIKEADAEEPEKGDREESKKSLSQLRYEKGYSLEQLSNDMEKPAWLDKIKRGDKTRPIIIALQDAISQNFLRFVQEELLELGYPEQLLENQIDQAINEVANSNNIAISDLWCLVDAQQQEDY